jgi:hypothetical protein
LIFVLELLGWIADITPMNHSNSVNSGFMSNLPHATRTERIAFPSAAPSGSTEVGYVAYRFDGINETSKRVFGITRQDAVKNLDSFLNS